MIIPKDDLEKILKTGWQSWSWSDPDSAFKIPPCCFPPQKLSIPKKLDLKIKLKKPIKGWCSYYAFGININQKNILAQTTVLEANGLTDFKYILIDGGWTEWGDWMNFDKNRFPNGIKNLAAIIKSRGFEPGIWLAPFLVSPQSMLFKKHPEWMVKNCAGRLVEGLRLIPGNHLLHFKRYILDITKPQVVRYLTQSVQYLIEECQFSLLKLDWLYGIYSIPGLTMQQIDNFLHTFLLTIKQKYPKVYTIGCGCPLIPAIGAIDSMRIGADILIPGVQKIPIVRELTNRYLYQKALENAAKRGWTNKYWNVDLDAFCCRESLGLSDKELTKMQSIILNTQGNIFLGDDISTLPKDRITKFILPLLKN